MVPIQGRRPMNLAEFGQLFGCSTPEILKKLRDDKNDFWRWWWTQFASEPAGIRHCDLRRTMSQFGRMLASVDVAPFLQEIEDKPQDWFANTSRKGIGVQQHTDSIPLRQAVFRPAVGADNVDVARDIQESAETELAGHYPGLMQFLQHFSEHQAKGTLSRAMIVRLAGKKDVGRHWDNGYYYLCRDRYHLILRSTGSQMECAGARCVWNTGELWWFNNNLWHSASHEAADWRVHVIFDVLPHRNRSLVDDFKQHTPYYRIAMVETSADPPVGAGTTRQREGPADAGAHWPERA